MNPRVTNPTAAGLRRRDLIRGLAGMAAVYSVHHAVRLASPPPQQTGPQQVFGPVVTPKSPSFGDRFIMALGQEFVAARTMSTRSWLVPSVANGVLSWLMDRWGKSAVGKRHGIGNADNERLRAELKTHPKSTLFAITGLASFEEVFSRALPAFAFTGAIRGRDHWGLGLTTSFVFGLLHMTKTKGLLGLGFNRDSLPIPQTLSGLLLWLTMRREGLVPAMMAHASYNLVWAALQLQEIDQEKIQTTDPR